MTTLMGIYEGIHVTDSSAYSRLDDIAAHGFSVVINYSLLLDHMTDIQAYLSHAHSVGLQFLIPLNNPAIWKNNTIGATYPLLSADATAAGYSGTTDNGFTTYIVTTLKNQPGLYGYYLADEIVNSDHAAMVTHSGYVHSADSSKPRLIIEAASDIATSACFNATSTFYDCAEIMGDDFYPVGDADSYTGLTTASVASGIQSFCTTHSLQSAMVLQAFSWANYRHDTSPWPSNGQMLQARNDCLANMNPALILWYSYFDMFNSPTGMDPFQWIKTYTAVQGNSTCVYFSW